MPDFVTDQSISALETKASSAAELLKSLANEKRLLILCRIVEQGEVSVMAMAEGVGLSQSAVSQHLARMREEGIIAARRDGQTMFYHLADPRVVHILQTLKKNFC